jgi:CheY-like chemotaxis protein
MNLNELVILYVEDEARSRRVMQMMASDMDILALVIFEDSTEFLSRAEALDPAPDLIFLDIHVTPHTGFEMLAMLRGSETLKDVPVVAMTASVMNEEIDHLRTAGFDGCLAKPIDIETFPDSVQRILDGEAVWRIIA